MDSVLFYFEKDGALAKEFGKKPFPSDFVVI